MSWLTVGFVVVAALWNSNEAEINCGVILQVGPPNTNWCIKYKPHENYSYKMLYKYHKPYSYWSDKLTQRFRLRVPHIVHSKLLLCGNHRFVPIVWGFQEQDITVSLGYKQMIWLCYAHNIRFMVDDHPSDNENPNKNYMNPY